MSEFMISKINAPQINGKFMKLLFLLGDIIGVFIKLVMALSIFSMAQCIFFLYVHKLPQDLCVVCESARKTFKEIIQSDL